MCINIYNVIKRLRLCHVHCSNICCFQYYYPLPQRELVLLCPVLGPPGTEYLSPQRQLALVCPY